MSIETYLAARQFTVLRGARMYKNIVFMKKDNFTTTLFSNKRHRGKNQLRLGKLNDKRKREII